MKLLQFDNNQKMNQYKIGKVADIIQVDLFKPNLVPTIKETICLLFLVIPHLVFS